MEEREQLISAEEQEENFAEAVEDRVVLIFDNDYTNIFEDDTINPYYKTWEEIPVSTLWFNSNTSQICFVAVKKNEAVDRINEKSLPIDTIAYEYRENIKLKNDEVILQVEIDTSNMFDTTNIIELNNNNKNNAPLIRAVKPIIRLGYTSYMVIYQIKDNRAVKNIQKI